MGRTGTAAAVLAAFALTLVCVSGAGARDARADAAATLQKQLATSAGAAAYLRSLVIDPAGVVIQRGKRNHAGPGCPGAGWNCTSARRVLQLSSAGGTNSATCQRVGSGSGVTQQTCVIVQTSTSGSNKASCIEKATVAGASVVQDCKITQTAGSGKNEAVVEQTLMQGPSCDTPPPASQDQQQTGRQSASIVQASPAGAMDADVTQNVIQCVVSATTGGVGQAQSTDQQFTILQGPPGFDPANPVCTGKSGALKAHAVQTQRHGARATGATTGSQDQSANLVGDVDQCSNSHAEYTVVQADDQRMFAPTGVAQQQNGPVRCCSFQGKNPSDTCTIQQTGSQQAHALADQFESIAASAGTSGNCNSNASVTQNGVTNTSSQSGSVIDNDGLETCQNGICGEPVPTALSTVLSSPTATGTFLSPVTLSSTLTRGDTSAPVPGQPLTFTLGSQTCTATTDATGTGSCTVTIGQPAGSVPLSVQFAGVPPLLLPSTASGSFTIEKAPTRLAYGWPTSGKKGTSVTVSATLTSTGGVPVAGRNVSFVLGSGYPSLGAGATTGSPPSCTATTSASGVAGCSLTLPYSTGTRKLAVSFAGDGFYKPSMVAVSFVVRAY